jgi:hypothetical protein
MDEPPRLRTAPSAKAAGCLAALAFFGPLIVPVGFLLAWSAAHCEPEPDCDRNPQASMLFVLAVLGGMALILGLAVHALVLWRIRRRIGAHGPFPLAAAVAACLVGLFWLALSPLILLLS